MNGSVSGLRRIALSPHEHLMTGQQDYGDKKGQQVVYPSIYEQSAKYRGLRRRWWEQEDDHGLEYT